MQCITMSSMHCCWYNVDLKGMWWAIFRKFHVHMQRSHSLMFMSNLHHQQHHQQQVVPDELVKMAERYESWRERKDIERGEGRGGGGGGGGFGGGGGGGRRGGGFGGGGRRDRNMSSFI